MRDFEVEVSYELSGTTTISVYAEDFDEARRIVDDSCYDARDLEVEYDSMCITVEDVLCEDCGYDECDCDCDREELDEDTEAGLAALGL